jgi:hypothetical protein
MPGHSSYVLTPLEPRTQCWLHPSTFAAMSMRNDFSHGHCGMRFVTRMSTRNRPTCTRQMVEQNTSTQVLKFWLRACHTNYDILYGVNGWPAGNHHR